MEGERERERSECKMHRRIFAKKKKKKKKYIITNAKCHLPRSCLPPHCRKPNWFTQKFAGNENAPPRCATIPNFYTSPALVTTGPNCPSKHLWRCLTRRILDVAKPVQPCQFFINIRVFCIPTLPGGKNFALSATLTLATIYFASRLGDLGGNLSSPRGIQNLRS